MSQFIHTIFDDTDGVPFCECLAHIA